MIYPNTSKHFGLKPPVNYSVEFLE